MRTDERVDGRVLRVINGLREPRLIVICIGECDALGEFGNEMRENDDGNFGLWLRERYLHGLV
jgi:hypothetical protein